MLLSYNHPLFYIGIIVFKFVAHLFFTLVFVFSSCNQLPLCVGLLLVWLLAILLIVIILLLVLLLAIFQFRIILLLIMLLIPSPSPHFILIT